MLFGGGGGAQTELRLIITGDGKIAIREMGKVDASTRMLAKRTTDWNRVLRQTSRIMMGIGAAGVAGYGAAIKVAAKFESTMTDVALQSRATAEEMQAIKETALAPEMIALGKSGNDAAQMFKRLASEGYDVVQMKKLLLPITRATIFLGQEEGETTKLLLNLMQQFNYEASDMVTISDELAKGLASTSFQGDELAQVMSYVGSEAGRMGMSIRDTTIITDFAMKKIGDASRVGTGFRMVLAKIEQGSKGLRSEFAKAGISYEELLASTSDGATMTDVFRRAVEGGAKMLKAFEVRAGAVANMIAQHTAPEVEALRKEFDAAAGAEEYAAEKMATFEGQLAILKATLTKTGIEIGTQLLPNLTELVKRLGETEDVTGKVNIALKIMVGIGIAGFFMSATIKAVAFAKALRDIGMAAGLARAGILGIPGLVIAGAAVGGVAISEAVRKREAGETWEQYQSRQAKTEKLREASLGGGLAGVRARQELERLGRGPTGLSGLLDILGDSAKELGIQMAGFTEEQKAANAEIETAIPGLKKYGDIGEHVIDILRREQAQMRQTFFSEAGLKGGVAAIEEIIKTNEDWMLQNPTLLRQLEQLQAALARLGKSAVDLEQADWGEFLRGQIESLDAMGEQMIKARSITIRPLTPQEQRLAAGMVPDLSAGAMPKLPMALTPHEQMLFGGGLPGGRQPGAGMVPIAGYGIAKQVEGEIDDGIQRGGRKAERTWDNIADMMGGAIDQSISYGIASALTDSKYNWNEFVRDLERTVIQVTIEETIKEAGIGGFVTGILGGALKWVGGLLGFDNPLNDAMARFEGGRMAKLMTEGAEGYTGTRQVRGKAEPAQVVNIYNTQNIRSTPPDERRLARSTVRQLEKVNW